MDLHDDIRGRSPIQFLTPTDMAWLECRYQTEFRKGYYEIRISSFLERLDAMSMSSVLPAVLFLAWLIRRADRQAWLIEEFPPRISASQYWDPSEPGWLGCHNVMAKLISVTFK